MARIAVADAGGINVCAFLDTIAISEIGATMLADPRTDDGYKVLVGSTPGNLRLFPDYSRHPHVLYRMLDSTAAGRYQIIYPTFAGLSSELHLTDFSPVTQDRMAIQLTFERGALPSIMAGDIAHAIILCNPEWASLPGAGATLPDGTPQHTNQMASLLAAYESARAKYA